MSNDDSELPRPPSYRDRIAILPGDPPIAYRPRVVLLDEAALAGLAEEEKVTPIFVVTNSEGEVIPDPPPFGQWYLLETDDAPARVDQLTRADYNAQLDIVYFANDVDCCGCPPHPALAASGGCGANPWAANPWSANPWSANPWSANPWSANPWSANAESLNLAATRKPPMSSVMPAPDRVLPKRPPHPANNPVIGVLDSGLAGGWDNADGLRPKLLGLDHPSLQRITGASDVPSRPIAPDPADNYLDPVAGHGTFIAGIVEQLTPGCKIDVRGVFEPQGDVSVSTLAPALRSLMSNVGPSLVNFSFGGAGRDIVFEQLIDHYHEKDGVVFVVAAGNEGTCVEQYPAALWSVIGVAAAWPDRPGSVVQLWQVGRRVRTRHRHREFVLCRIRR